MARVGGGEERSGKGRAEEGEGMARGSEWGGEMGGVEGSQMRHVSR